MANNRRPDPPGKGALLAAADVIKYLTALGTGAIVFSAGLLSDKILLSGWAKCLIFVSWVLLAISVAGGLVAGMRIPIQLSKKNYNLEDPYFEPPIRIQQFTFFFGIVTLGLALASILLAHDHRDGGNDTPTTGSPTPQSSPKPSPSTSPRPTETLDVIPSLTPKASAGPSTSPTPTLSPSPQKRRKSKRKRCRCRTSRAIKSWRSRPQMVAVISVNHHLRWRDYGAIR